ncbi:MAG TPA: methyltransferase [Candidatus Jeotgalicoccus stercoravium]|nr:methyltransferase [Candidatus Jeotgalicoccus stercoravium]
MSHYYTTDDSPHDYNEITFNFKEHNYRFKTDRGVFSKNQVDYGSHVLLSAVTDDFSGQGKFIDMGAGYGPIGIVLAKTLSMTPIMVEVNEDALMLTNENIKRENIDGIVLSREKYEQADYKVSLYVTNPPFRAGKKTVLDIIDDAYERLLESGSFYMVVQKKQGMPSYKKYLKDKFSNVTTVVKDKGYYILRSVK